MKGVPITMRDVGDWCKRNGVWLAVTCAAIAVILGGAVGAQATMLYARGWRVSWGTIPDWLAAVGGVATLGAAVVAWVVYRHDVRSRGEDKVARTEEIRRQHADAIAAWQADQPYFSSSCVERGTPNLVRVNILNASSVAFYDVAIVVLGKPTGRTIFHFEHNSQVIKTQWVPQRDRVAWGNILVVPPGPWQVEVHFSTPCVRADQVHIFFRDHRGVYWWRDYRGNLSEQAPLALGDDHRGGRGTRIAHALGEEDPLFSMRALVPIPLTNSDVAANDSRAAIVMDLSDLRPG